MIPKILHYCWFGRGVKPDYLIRCLDSWRKYLHDWEIIEWNEDNFDVTVHPYTHLMYVNSEMSYVTDYVRVAKLYEYGGVYVDTDMLLHKSLNDLLDLEFAVAYSDTTHRYISNGILLASKQSKYLRNQIEVFEAYRETMLDYVEICNTPITYNQFIQNTPPDVTILSDTLVSHSKIEGEYATPLNTACWTMYKPVLNVLICNSGFATDKFTIYYPELDIHIVPKLVRRDFYIESYDVITLPNTSMTLFVTRRHMDIVKLEKRLGTKLAVCSKMLSIPLLEGDIKR